MGKKIAKEILLGTVLTILSGFVAIAQDIGNLRSSVYETRTCEYSEVDDYKHAHFNRAMDGRDNERINIRTMIILQNENYKQQAGAPPSQTMDGSIIWGREVSEDDKIVNERDYKHIGSIL